MKKLYISILIFFLYSALFPAGINVSNPDGLEYWNIGDTKKIEWGILGETHRYVKIRLFDKTGITKVLDIIDRTPNNGEFEWTLPQTLHEGEYIIRVKTADNNFFGDSEVFHIQDRRLIRINLISPSGGSRYLTPGTMLFKWDMENAHLVEKVKIIIKKGRQVISSFITRNDGPVSRPLTDNINDGTDYSVRIEDADDPSIFDESGYFEIYHSSEAGINIVKPDKLEYQSGVAMKIQWESTGFDGKVNISLLKNNSKVWTLVKSNSQNPFNFKFGNNTIGEYQIRIEAFADNTISDTSNKFLIFKSSDLFVFSRRGIFEKGNFQKGERTKLRFRVKNPSDETIPVTFNVKFLRGKFKRSSPVNERKVFLKASTRYAGRSSSYINGGRETPFELPVTINDNSGDYTVIITVIPSVSSDIRDPKPGNNTIYGYYKVFLKTLNLIKKK